MTKRKHGFTLIELLIVLSLLIVVSVPVYQTAQTYLRSNHNTTNQLNLQTEAQTIMETFSQAISRSESVGALTGISPFNPESILMVAGSHQTEYFSLERLDLKDTSLVVDEKTFKKDDRPISTVVKSLDIKLLLSEVVEGSFNYNADPAKIQGIGVHLILEDQGVSFEIKRDILLQSFAIGLEGPGGNGGDGEITPKEEYYDDIRDGLDIILKDITLPEGIDDLLDHLEKNNWTEKAYKDWLKDLKKSGDLGEDLEELIEDMIEDIEEKYDIDFEDWLEVNAFTQVFPKGLGENFKNISLKDFHVYLTDKNLWQEDIEDYFLPWLKTIDSSVNKNKLKNLFKDWKDALESWGKMNKPR